MTDYAKKTVKELQELLSGKGLAVSGKKAELVARLQESEKPAEEETAAPARQEATAPPISPPPPPAADSETTTAPTLANPATATTSIAATEASAPTTASALAQDVRESSATTDTKLANAVDYSMNLPTSSLDDELKKRKARAERFGTGAAANGGAAETEAAAPAPEDDKLKALERAKRFGASENAMGKLDEALPIERERGGRKRGRGDEDAAAGGGAYDDPGLKFGRGDKRRFERSRGRGGRTGGGSDRPQGVVKTSSRAFSSEKDRLAAEARRKKFGG